MSDKDWEKYPEGDVPKPTGELKLIDGDNYISARASANNANKILHQNNPSAKGLQYHEVQPVKYGGSPTNTANKVLLTPKEHAKYTTF